MTCYFRHIGEVLSKANIEVTTKNKREIDRVIYDLVGVDYKNCSSVWREIKNRLAKDEAEFVAALNKAWNSR